jgi:hypothetical protein
MRVPGRLMVAIALVLAPLVAGAQPSPPREPWRLERDDDGPPCSLVLRDWANRFGFDIMRRRGGEVFFVFGTVLPEVPPPVVGRDRLGLTWIAPDGGEAGFDLPLSGVRPRGEGRPMMMHARIRPGPVLDRMMGQAAAARSVRITLPGASPFEVLSPGLAEAWAASSACAG